MDQLGIIDQVKNHYSYMLYTTMKLEGIWSIFFLVMDENMCQSLKNMIHNMYPHFCAAVE